MKPEKRPLYKLKQCLNKHLRWSDPGFGLLLNGFFGATVVEEVSALQAMRLMTADLAGALTVLSGGLAFYAGSAFLTGLVMLPVAAVRKRRMPGVPFLAWSTSLNAFLIGLGSTESG